MLDTQDDEPPDYIEFWSLQEDAILIEDVRDNVDQVLFQEGIQSILLYLNERERKVLHYRMWDNLTQKQTGKLLGVSGGRIGEIESKAIRKLRRPKILNEIVKLAPDWVEASHKKRNARLLEESNEFLQEQERQRLEWEEKQRIRRQQSRAVCVPNRIVFRSCPIEPEVKPNPLPPVARPPSAKCPSIVLLARYPDGTPYLRVMNPLHSIERRRDPETYDTWLNQRLEEEALDKSALQERHDKAV